MHKTLVLLFWLNACNAGYLFENKRIKSNASFNNLFSVKKPFPELTNDKKSSLWNHKISFKKKRLEYTLSRKIDL